MTLDFAPLFRTAIGFDRMARLVNSAQEAATAQSYPPYNIERTGEDSYRLTMAVAGFSEDDRAWKVRADGLVVKDEAGRVVGCNLDLKNPKAAEDIEHLPPEQLADDILQKELRIAEIMGEIKALLGRGT